LFEVELVLVLREVLLLGRKVIDLLLIIDLPLSDSEIHQEIFTLSHLRSRIFKHELVILLTTNSNHVQILVLILNSDILDVVVPITNSFADLVKAVSTFNCEHAVVPVRVVEHAVAPKFDFDVILVIISLAHPRVTPVKGLGDDKALY
jgi:hypothetical protein